MATKTWNGASVTTGNWTDATNWVGGVAPVAGDDLIFAGSTRLTNNNDFTAGTSFNSIALAAGGGTWVITGNALVLGGGAAAFACNATTGTPSFAPAITFSTAAPTIAVAASSTLQLTGTIATGGLALTVNPTGTLYIDSTISGTGVFTMSGSGQVILGGNNTYSSGTQLNSGTASPRHNNAFGTGIVTCAGSTTLGGAFAVGPGGNYTLPNAFVLTSGTTTVVVPFTNGTDIGISGGISGAGALLVTSDPNGRAFTLPNANTFSGGLTLGQGSDKARLRVGNAASLGTGTLTVDQNGANGLETTSAVTLTNPITINSGKIFNLDAGNPITLSGVISGAGGFTQKGTAVCTVTNANTYTGATIITAGTLLVNGSLASGSAVSVSTLGTLGGSGTVNGAITLASGGIIRPGVATGVYIGTLTTAAVTCTGGTYSVDLNGTTPTFDQLNSSGTVALGAAVAALTVPSLVNSAAGKVYTIVNAVTAVTGTFAGRPGGSIISAFGRNLQVAYTATTVTLTDLGAGSGGGGLLLMFS